MNVSAPATQRAVAFIQVCSKVDPALLRTTEQPITASSAQFDNIIWGSAQGSRLGQHTASSCQSVCT
eukprot:4509455-Karenia_brevis.AAC.1